MSFGSARDSHPAAAEAPLSLPRRVCPESPATAGRHGLGKKVTSASRQSRRSAGTRGSIITPSAANLGKSPARTTPHELPRPRSWLGREGEAVRILISVAVSAHSRAHPATPSVQRPQIACGSAIGRPILWTTGTATYGNGVRAGTFVYWVRSSSLRERIQGASHAAGSSLKHVGEDHGRRDVFVPKQFLNGANVGCRFKKMGRERVSERVAGHTLEKPNSPRRLGDCYPEGTFVEVVSARLLGA